MPGVVVADELTVSVAVTAALPVIAGGAETVQVGAPAAVAGEVVTAQLRATAPVKPPLGVTVMAEVAEAPATSVRAVPLSAKSADA